MKKIKFISLAVFLIGFAQADIIALKSGQLIGIPGSFEVKGAFVVYTNDDGELVQLPLKIVDLERSQAATQEHIAALEAEAAAKAAEKPEPVKVKSITDVSAAIEGRRDQDDVPPQDLEITGSNVSKFVSNNPQATNTAQVGGGVSGRSGSEIIEAQNQHREAYSASLKDAEKIDQEIAKIEQNLRVLEQENAFGDNPSTGLYETTEKMRARLTELKSEKQNKDSEVSRLSREAKAAGVRDHNRGRSTRQAEPTEEGVSIEYKASEEDEFTYDPSLDAGNDDD